MPKRDVEEQSASTTGPVKGDFIAPPEVADVDERADALPQQEEFWRPPTRFGSVPVEKEPLGWDRRRGFRKLFPAVYLPFQVVERVAFGHPALNLCDPVHEFGCALDTLGRNGMQALGDQFIPFGRDTQALSAG